MSKPGKTTLDVQGTNVTVIRQVSDDFISLTDIAKHKEPGRSDHVIQNWMRSRNTIEFLGVWERLNNTDFKPLEFEGFKKQAGLNSFVLTPRQWIDTTNASGLVSKSGRYGGTFAHKDIAFEFASWISVEFKLYLIKEFQRLKDDESDRLKLGWNLQRTLSKINYRIHTDAIRDTLIPPAVSNAQATLVYANEADLLNVALFGQTAKQWRDSNPDADGNIRDHAPLEQLVVLTNLESLNAVLIRQGLTQADRLHKLNEIAISQMRTLLNDDTMKRLK
ncbi:MAG: KilA-N domain-containing protein [Gammaproteobacteria bacterium]|nr:KilA-N domain-containing protein [Gammaproteobacteria bacterium]